MSSLTLLIIRHAEKPAKKPGDPDFGPGLTPLGEQDKHSLVVRGWQRAGAWAALFGPGGGQADYPTPNVIYAADPNQDAAAGADDDDSVSQRPYETVLPLAQRLTSTTFTTSFGVGDEVQMLNSARGQSGAVLIAWEHKRIIEAILPELAKGQSIPNLPTNWPGSRFDVVLRFYRAQSNAAWEFAQLFPQLLSGDSDAPL